VNIEHGVALARMTTIGTGGPARALARPRSLTELEEAVRYAQGEGLEVVVIGLGSNVLAADEGVDALVVRLEGALADAEARGELVVAGESWKCADLDELSFDNLHVQQVMRARMGNREGIGVMEQLAIGPHERSGFKDFFDGAE